MATRQHPEKRRLLSLAVVAGAALFLAGCQLEPKLLTAQSRAEGSEYVITVTISATAARSIKRRQLYTWLVLVNCSGPLEKFPSEPSIAGQPVPEFQFPITGPTVDLVARVPASIFAQYSEPCAFLEGGGYFTGKIQSSLIPILRDQGSEPNNSFKRTAAPKYE